MSPTRWTPGVPHHVDELRTSFTGWAGAEGQDAAEQMIELRVSFPSPGTCVLGVIGEVDMLTAPAVDSMVASQLEAWPRTLILDLHEVEFLSSTGLASLVTARDAAAQVGTRLRLVCTGQAVLRPMVITGLAGMFDVYADLEAALCG